MLGAKLNKLIWKFSLTIWEREYLPNFILPLKMHLHTAFTFYEENVVLVCAKSVRVSWVVAKVCCAVSRLCLGVTRMAYIRTHAPLWLCLSLVLKGSWTALFIICTVLWGPLIMLSRFLRKKHHHLEVIGYFMSVFFWTSLFIKES